MSVVPITGGHSRRSQAADQPLEQEFRHWCEGLRPGGHRHDATVAELHELLLRASRHELARRRHQLGSITGPELEDLAEQSADDAVLAVMRKLDDFRRASRFTTWAYKFAIFEVSARVARHEWRHRSSDGEPAWETIPDSFRADPETRAIEREMLALLSKAIEEELTEHQRHVFVAVALNDVSIDVLALQLDSNRNAIYKNLFDARKKLRSALAGAGHDPGGSR
jgi:RNA polymerase sigma-70 factor (ECF subfamily)